MTHSFEKAAVLSIGLVGMVGSAFAAQPPDVVQSAQQSTAMGTGALQNLGDAGNDTAAGYLAAYNTSGGANTAFGTFALYTDWTGGGTTAVGNEALEAGNGNYNTAVGAFTMARSESSSSGSQNTAIGSNALFHNGNGNAQRQRTQLRDMQSQIAKLAQINQSMQAAITKLKNAASRVAMR